MKDRKNYRTPLKNARGLGSAHHGTGHWWMQRVTSIALIPLCLYFLFTFMIYVVFGGIGGTLLWLHSPIAAVLVILLIAVGFHHAASGMQVVIEDYVHCETSKLTLVILVKFGCAAFALLGILSVAKIYLGV